MNAYRAMCDRMKHDSSWPDGAMTRRGGHDHEITLNISAVNRHGIGLQHGRRTLSMGVVKPGNDDEDFSLQGSRQAMWEQRSRLIPADEETAARRYQDYERGYWRTGR